MCLPLTNVHLDANTCLTHSELIHHHPSNGVEILDATSFHRVLSATWGSCHSRTSDTSELIVKPILLGKGRYKTAWSCKVVVHYSTQSEKSDSLFFSQHFFSQSKKYRRNGTLFASLPHSIESLTLI